MRSMLIVNPEAGPRDVRRELPAVLSHLEDHGWQTSLYWTHRPGEATDLARQAAHQDLNAVFAVGGDGTINEIINGLAESPVALGVLPGGTGNVWAKGLGLPTRSLRHLQPLVASVRALVPGAIRRIDLGKVNGRYFLQWTGVGLDAEVNQIMEPRTRPQRRLGALAYLIAGVTTALNLVGTQTRIWVDGERICHRAILVVISNSQLYGSIARIAPDARLDDGLLDMHLFAGTGFGAALRAALGVISGLHVRDPRHCCSQGRVIWLETDKPMAVAVDGEPFGVTPVACEVVPRALSILMPQYVCPDLFSGWPTPDCASGHPELAKQD
jgi:diacylglycerol kinase (ATP)